MVLGTVCALYVRRNAEEIYILPLLAINLHLGFVKVNGMWTCLQMILMMMRICRISPKYLLREPLQSTAIQAARWTNTLPRLVIYCSFFFLQEMQRTVSAVAFNFLCFLFCVFLQELKVVLLGSSLNWFSIEWRNQGFTFSETHDLRYGIVQKKVFFTVLFKNSSMTIFIHLTELQCHALYFCFLFLFISLFSRVALVEFWHQYNPLFLRNYCLKTWKTAVQDFSRLSFNSELWPTLITAMLFTAINSHQGVLCHCYVLTLALRY